MAVRIGPDAPDFGADADGRQAVCKTVGLMPIGGSNPSRTTNNTNKGTRYTLLTMLFTEILQKVRVPCPYNGTKPFERDHGTQQFLKNLLDGMDECGYQRQTGRSTMLALEVVDRLIHSKGEKLTILVYNSAYKTLFQKDISAFLEQLGYNPQRIKVGLIRLGNNEVEIEPVRPCDMSSLKSVFETKAKDGRIVYVDNAIIDMIEEF